MTSLGIASSVFGEKGLSGEKNSKKRPEWVSSTSSVFLLNRFEITRFFPDGGRLEKSLVLGNGAGGED